MIWKITCNVLDFTGDFRQAGLKKKKIQIDLQTFWASFPLNVSPIPVPAYKWQPRPRLVKILTDEIHA